MLITREAARARGYNFAFLNENAKREIRRKTLKAVAIPGYQVSFASPELPIARGWGTGGLQLTMSLIGPGDVLKVIDQGCDGGVNAVNIRDLLVKTTGVRTTWETARATIIQTRHRIPEEKMRTDQILVLQVPGTAGNLACNNRQPPSRAAFCPQGGTGASGGKSTPGGGG